MFHHWLGTVYRPMRNCSYQESPLVTTRAGLTQATERALQVLASCSGANLQCTSGPTALTSHDKLTRLLLTATSHPPHTSLMRQTLSLLSLTGLRCSVAGCAVTSVSWHSGARARGPQPLPAGTPPVRRQCQSGCGPSRWPQPSG